MPKSPKIQWKQLFPYASNAARELLDNLLQFDPEKRLTVEEALGHAYLESYHDVEDEPAHAQLFDFSFESVESIEDMKGVWNWLELIAREVNEFKFNLNSGNEGASLPPVPRPAEPLPAPSNQGPMAIRDDKHAIEGAMDIDEELKLMGQ